MKTYSFTDLINNYGEANPPELQNIDNSDVKGWQEKLFSAVSSLRSSIPERVKLETEILETVEKETHIQQLVDIPVSSIASLPAYVLIPKDIKDGEKRPAILASHGHIGDGMGAISGAVTLDEENRNYGLQAVEAGFIVICLSWWGWMGRDGHLERINEHRDRCNVIQFTAAMYGINVLDLHIQDAEAAIDYLCSMGQVDENNIGCMGNSYGGRTAMWMAIFDKRIKATVAAGSMNTFRERSLKLASCGIQALPGVLKYCDVPELFCLIAPRALQLQAGAVDNLITPADRDAMHEKVNGVFENLNNSEKYDYVLHDGGHYLKWSEAERFFKKQLI
ncbi:MAG: dienelactone hydrolase family protein [Planctomycetota bacterium]